jgi:hypothetical protein
MIPSDRKGPSVKHLCTIDCTLDIPFAALAYYTGAQGGKLKKMEYEIEMIPSGATVEFVVYIDGRRQGGQNASIQFG